MTPTQKLKAEISKLTHELDILANEPHSVEGVTIKMQWVLKRRLEDTIMQGSPTSSVTTDDKIVVFDDESPDYIRSSQEEI